MSTQQELKQQGNIHFQNNNFEKAIEFYTLAIEKDAFCDEAAPILSNRSLCYYNIGKYKEAYEDGGCCCGIRPDWAKGFARRGFAAEQLKEWQIALESYEEYLKLSNSDEMGIAVKKNRVKQFVNELEKKKQEREKELQRYDVGLSMMEDGTEYKQRLVCSLLEFGCLGMDIDKIELAVSHGASLFRPFLMSETVPFEKRFTNADFADAEQLLMQSSFDEIACSAVKAILALSIQRSHDDDSQFDQTALLSKRRDYLDRLLDVAERQKIKYPPNAQLMSTGFDLLLAGGSRYPLTTDLFLLLITEKGRNFFVGDATIMSMTQWRLHLVQKMLFMSRSLTTHPETLLQRTSKSGQAQRDSDANDRPSGLHLRRILECLEIGLHGMTADDINTKIETEDPTKKRQNCFIRRSLLDVAASYPQVPEILEFLLRRGANANERLNWSTHPAIRSVLDNSLHLHQHSCARMLLSYGAKLATDALPTWISQHPVYSSLMLPQASYYHPVLGFLCEKYNDTIGEEVNEDSIRMLFDAMTEQNVSFVGVLDPEDDPLVYTPLTFAFLENVPLKLIQSILKVRPKLLNTPIPPPPSMSNHMSTLYYPAMFLCNSLATHVRNSAMISSLDYYKSVMKLIFDLSDCDVDELLWCQTADSTVTFAQGLREMIEGEGKRIAQQLEKLEEFCINYTEKKKEL